MRSKLAILFCLVLLVALAIPASADEYNKKTIVTFSQPVEIPGMVLPAGTYVFKLLNSSSNRNIVLVYNEAEDHLFKMILAINNYQLFPTGDPVLKFGEERAAGAPQPLRAWFGPGDNWGQEFVYEKARAVRIAETTGERVLEAEVTREQKPEELIETHVAAVTPEKEVEEIPQEVAEAPPVEFPAAAPEEHVAVVAEPAIEELPKTASPLPLVVLLGLSSLALAGLLKFSLTAR